MDMRSRQKGLSFISIMIIIAIGSFLVLFVIKLFPVYMEDFSVSSSVESLKKEPGKGPQELRTALFRRFQVNNITNVTREDVAIERDGNSYVVTVDYEVRRPFFHNIDFVVSFTHEAVVPSS